MVDSPHAAYCFFQDIEPRSPLSAVFERDYLLYAVKGALNITIDKQSWLLPPSFAAWIPANTAFIVDIAKPVTSCSVLIRPQFCTNFPEQPSVFQMSELACGMIQHCKRWGAEDVHPPEAEVFFLALLNLCADLVDISVDVRRPYSHEPSIQKALQISEGRLEEALKAADVAKAANLSERTMQRRFSDSLGMTWSQALSRLRMIKAIELLSDTSLSIIQVAGYCGFTSLSAFNRAFLSFADTTPSEFRKRLQGY
ncbi:helix-turn-helix domain-containing protein [Lentilitoribacter sp. Alg239-R112]|uniref:helix-turn-helix domain-containing protein n=1 Tax=Lentilitoribacter sp. Alg239-R112 TaxID=2305987 RepID=UPI0013A6D4C0|nr:helix-turn-helix domain-containing protein [Lentilitoribacter sp. Alg239-R112]